VSAVQRIDQIIGDVNAARGVMGGGRSFADILAAAGPGGPVIELENDPKADLVLAGFDPEATVADRPPIATPATGSDSPAATPAIGTPATGAPPTDTPAAPADPVVGPIDAQWAERLPAAGADWAGDIEAAAANHDLDPRLLAALVWSESAFQPDAVSSAGAIGLTQLMPETAATLGVDPHDPQQNLEGGARFLRMMLDRFGSERLALAAYNAGPGRVERAGGVPDIAETQAYVSVVLDRYEHLGAS
jgi:soluble lytic murein transglycosylase-like protein